MPQNFPAFLDSNVRLEHIAPALSSHVLKAASLTHTSQPAMVLPALLSSLSATLGPLSSVTSHPSSQLREYGWLVLYLPLHGYSGPTRLRYELLWVPACLGSPVSVGSALP